MKLNTLKLTYFKNYEGLQASFGVGINCLVGKNGMGKTNLLDAMYYLSMTRSALSGVDAGNIQYNQPFFAINGLFTREGEDIKVDCYFEQGKKKVLKVAGKELEKLSNHIGVIPSVMILPDDTAMIKEGSEIRRKFFDSVIAQQDSSYMESLMEMHRLLKQRNSFLKGNDGRLNIDQKLLEVYDESLFPLFQKIALARGQFIEDFEPYFQENYRLIFDGEEAPKVCYKSSVLDENFKTDYQKAIQKDIILQRTTLGAHRDDYVFGLNDRSIKKSGSQGQQKSFIIALKLAEYDFLKYKKGFSPLLLLDDIFDKLDDERIERLVALLSDQERFAQVFITDARAERSRQYFDGQDVRFYHIEKGSIDEG